MAGRTEPTASCATAEPEPAPGPPSGPAYEPAAPGRAEAAAAVRIREMTLDDCEAVATVRVRGWQHAYRGVVPQTYLDAMSIEEDAARRREYLAKGEGRVVDLVAERAGQVVGWGCCGPSRDEGVPDRTAELYALYVLPERIGTGVGGALVDALTARAEAAGASSLLLWVLAANDRARRFYARAGFAPDGTEAQFEVDGVSVSEVRYARRLSASVAAEPRRG
ncbi:GNAT family N-acetyltransferase [Streptomyces sp. GMY02]|uniref:GNAT family N-acetyltransferase n=1 Tax=Streptomyces sp. GMY02 TaxID=1333528 RepID=UPI001C2C6086|nr:GNAT family N-acetyltransferase [Streptomyces sp. GMY02]QXE33956.1 GNAT family N-acetyltransferase [Streptomyces sp. GMY02]